MPSTSYGRQYGNKNQLDGAFQYVGEHSGVSTGMKVGAGPVQGVLRLSSEASIIV